MLIDKKVKRCEWTAFALAKVMSVTKEVYILKKYNISTPIRLGNIKAGKI